MNRLINIIKNKYFIAALAFVVWMLFFDRNDLSTQFEYRSQLKALNTEKDFYTKETERVKKDLEELSSDPNKLQKFAREKYLMKKDNEDVFVIVKQPKTEE
ncbi:Septum formation initiator [bacterium A37T11]|nr:Septum formation initiator [bacterium A37T11]